MFHTNRALIVFALAGIPALAQQTSVGVMAQLAAGGGQWNTTFTLLNTGTAAADITLNFYGDAGTPLTLPVFFPQSSSSATGASFTATMNPGAELIIETDALNDPLVTGWAELLSNGSVSGYAVFTDTVSSVQQQEAAVPLDNRNDPAYLVSFDNTGGFGTGIALVNEGGSANITVIIRDDAGTQVSIRPITLPAGGHTSFDLASTYLETANLRGSLEFDTPAGGQIAVLGLRFNPQTAFTSIPSLSKAVAGIVPKAR